VLSIAAIIAADCLMNAPVADHVKDIQPPFSPPASSLCSIHAATAAPPAFSKSAKMKIQTTAGSKLTPKFD
jgi:hypothetical protein